MKPEFQLTQVLFEFFLLDFFNFTEGGRNTLIWYLPSVIINRFFVIYHGHNLETYLFISLFIFFLMIGASINPPNQIQFNDPPILSSIIKFLYAGAISSFWVISYYEPWSTVYHDFGFLAMVKIKEIFHYKNGYSEKLDRNRNQ